MKLQISIAQGNPLPFTQEELTLSGHAIEARVYAEDPYNHFLPDTGRLITYRPPHGNGVRVDDGFEEGMEIPVYYDPLIAKLICYGATREEAIARMIRAIDEYRISGVETTLSFCKFVMQHEGFVSGNFDTHFVEKHFTTAPLLCNDRTEAMLAAALGVMQLNGDASPSGPVMISHGSPQQKWRRNRQVRD